MERRIDLSNIDLDAVANLIALRQPAWEDEGLSVEPLTWFDNEEDWPRTTQVTRSNVIRPMSVRLRVSTEADDGEVELIVYAGGWADVALWVPGSTDFEWEHPELDSADDLTPILDAAISRLAIDP